MKHKSKLFLGVFLSLLYGNAQAETWFLGELGGGYTTVSPSAPDRLSLSGPLFRIHGGLEFRKLGFGDIQLSLGFQENWQSGKTAAREQRLNVGSFLARVGYLHSIFRPQFLIGFAVEGWFGNGAQMNILNSTRFESVYLIGPQMAYRCSLNPKWDLVAGVSALFSLNGSNQSIFTLPLHLGLRMNLADVSKANKN